MNYKLLIDTDSIYYKCGYRTMNSLNIEHMYADVIKEVAKIEQALWTKFGYVKGDTLSTELLVTKGSNFRYDIYPEYKSNRKEKTELDNIVKIVKNLTLDRLEYASFVPNTEADDVIIALSNQPQPENTTLVISAIDKDVVNASLVPCYNYNKTEWVEPHTTQQVEAWYLHQSIEGDSVDKIRGVYKTGKVGAKKFIDGLLAGTNSKQDYIDLFESPEDCELQNRLVRMHQWNPVTEEVTLWTLGDWCLVTETNDEDDEW